MIGTKARIPLISLSYSWTQIQSANEIDNDFRKSPIEINLNRDVNNLKYKDNLEEFMRGFAKGDYIIILLSRDYLYSLNCMYEACYFIEQDDAVEKILPIVVKDKKGKMPNLTKELFECVKYWKSEYDNHISEADSYDAEQMEIVEKYRLIARNASKFINRMLKHKYITLEEAKKTYYKDVLDYINFDVIDDENYAIKGGEGYVSNITDRDLNDAKEEIVQLATHVIEALRERNFAVLSQFVSLEKGLTLTPYTVVSEYDLTFPREEIAIFGESRINYRWGYYDGSGFKIELTPKEYFDAFVYDKDFEHGRIVYHDIQHETGWKENITTAYPNGIFVEYYYEGDESEFKGFTWATLRLVFEKSQEDSNWYLVGLVHSQWTI